jgi:Fe-S-cluster containining protein
MKVQDRLSVLKQIYAIHHEYTSEVQTACARGCAACCTCNVTATTMEGLLVYEYLSDSGRSDQVHAILEAMPPSRYRPRLTLNQVVALCASGRQPPEEVNDPAAGICPLLGDGLCSIYPVRPLGCRAMLSSSECAANGAAEMPPFILSVNNVVLQHLEAVDRPGATGNLLDVLAVMAQDAQRLGYREGKGPDASLQMPANRSFPVLMVPPEHRTAIRPLIQSLHSAIKAFQ